MNYRKFSQNYAKEIGGEFREYDDKQSVIIVPLKRGRFQTVLATLLSTLVIKER